MKRAKFEIYTIQLKYQNNKLYNWQVKFETENISKLINFQKICNNLNYIVEWKVYY